MTALVFIGVPYWLGKTDQYTGSVDVVRESGIAAEFGAAWVTIDPDFDAHDDPVNAVNAATADAIKAALAQDQRPIIIAGDCTTCLGNMKGLENAQPDVLWYDAHGDFNTPETSPSGFLGGMPLAAMVGRGSPSLLEGIQLDLVAEDKIIISDGRDLDPEEARMVAESELMHLTDLNALYDIDWHGRAVYIHFDSDVVRLADLPAVSYPADGGPTLDSTIATLRYVIENAQVKGVHVTCWNNAIEGAAQSEAAVMAAIRAIAEELRG